MPPNHKEKPMNGWNFPARQKLDLLCYSHGGTGLYVTSCFLQAVYGNEL